MIARRGFCVTGIALVATARQPWAATPTVSAFKAAPGPWAVTSAPALSLRVADQNKDLQLRVTSPDAPGPFPVIVFSHGALSSKDLYNRVADHWATHGYATILPTHLDSESLGYSFKNPLPRDAVFFGRIGDMTFILDNLDTIAAKAGLAGRFDTTRMAVAGHSFGGWIALILAGLPVRMPDGTSKSFRDPRIKAMVAYNGIGPMDQIAAEAWADVKVPVFAASGTNDPGATGDGILRPWRWRIGAYDLAGAAEKYAVSITLGDHYYGGLICREGAGGRPDPEGLSYVNGASTAFLDAYLKDDGAARTFLRTADLRPLTADRAFLERTLQGSPP
jgi:predicted dienelactone hydrolase